MNAYYNRIRTAMRLLPVMGLAAIASAAHAGEGDIKLPEFGPTEWNLLWCVLAAAILCLVFGVWLRKITLAKPAGSASMVEVSDAVKAGAYAYLKQQIKMMLPFVIIIAVGLIFMYKPIYGDEKPMLYVGVGVAFFFGVMFSYLAGVVGMDMAVKANVRTANQAIKSFKGALETAFQAGAVSGMFTVGMGLLGAIVIFMIFKQDAMKVLVGFGFGGSLAALFMRVGGGIFTKAADVGADLVGKVEAGIPEDDPRNPATIADNVGDNVGDCAGMAADVFESYEVTLVAAIILGAACNGLFGPDNNGVLKLIIYALLVRVVGVFASVIGILAVRGNEDDKQDPMVPINKGFLLSWAVALVGFAVVSYLYMKDIYVNINGTAVHVDWWRFFAANSAGLLLAGVIDKLTEYFTSTEHKPVKDIAESSTTGAATMIISGFAVGLESSVWSVLAICGALMLPLFIFPPSLYGGSSLLSFYGIALTGLGLLSTTGFILAMDTFGPISDNAQGIFEMSDASEQSEDGRGARIVSRLDAVGNTTKALTKGFAIATAVIAAVALFHSFVADAGLKAGALSVDIPEIFIGLLIGGAAPFLFSSFTIQAVGRAATELILEVRRQFRERPGIMTFKEKPDYAACVAIVTAAAQKELLGPGIIAITLPVIVGFGMGYGDPIKGAQALGGYLVGAIVTGQLMAVLLSNSGGAWDNSKKLIEDGNYGGKGSDNHKAAVICDTVGDPFKDTAGPALNPLIKVMNLVGILMAPVVVSADMTVGTRTTIVVVAIVLFVFACWWSKRDGKKASA